MMRRSNRESRGEVRNGSVSLKFEKAVATGGFFAYDTCKRRGAREINSRSKFRMSEPTRVDG